MLILPMTTARPDVPPAVLLEESNYLAHFHATKPRPAPYNVRVERSAAALTLTLTLTLIEATLSRLSAFLRLLRSYRPRSRSNALLACLWLWYLKVPTDLSRKKVI
jgi:hypothetical protein